LQVEKGGGFPNVYTIVRRERGQKDFKDYPKDRISPLLKVRGAH